ncbi:hypothetical protein GCM10007857_77960 [Bradyrhizobium iriomotense]|uniref:Uncharacterized protein n=1 Tax=Bradyrhizobium iriomotense TaxID=441950 RepID=A0ABQ6BBL3_9BRAD|nr:hypothetical protein GCM10007857_77960 [Bradyrhizobium iriomotense]
MDSKTVTLPIDMLNLDGLDPRHIVVLEPTPVLREIHDRTWLERLKTAGLVIISEGIARRRRRQIGSKTEGFEIALAAGLGDIRPESHRLSENAMFYLARRKMCGERKSIWTGSDDRDGDPAHDDSWMTGCGVQAESSADKRMNRGRALMPI